MKKSYKILEIERRINGDLGDYLKREYVDNRKNSNEIGNEIGVSDSTIIRWLEGYEISRRSYPEVRLPEGIKKPSKDKLYDLYVTQDKSQRKIAKEIGVNKITISRWLEGYEISRRSYPEVRLPEGIKKPSKEEFYDLYITQDKNQREIAKEIGVNQATIRNWLRQYGISKKNSLSIDERVLRLLEET